MHILTYNLPLDTTSAFGWPVPSVRMGSVNTQQAHNVQRSLWRVMVPLELPRLPGAVTDGSETSPVQIQFPGTLQTLVFHA